MSEEEKSKSPVGRHGFTGTSYKMDQVEKAEAFDVKGQGAINKFRDTVIPGLTPGQIKTLLQKYPNSRMGIGRGTAKPSAEVAPATGEQVAFNEGIVKPRIPEDADEPNDAQTTT